MGDNTYNVKDVSRKAGSSYEDSPVQKQFGARSGIPYPCVYITTSKTGLQRHRVQSLSNLVKSDTEGEGYNLVLDAEGDVSLLGKMGSRSLRILLTSKIFDGWDIAMRLDEDTAYTDDMRFAFCSG